MTFSLFISLFPFVIYNENQRWQFVDFRKASIKSCIKIAQKEIIRSRCEESVSFTCVKKSFIPLEVEDG